MRKGASYRDAAERSSSSCLESGEPLPGFGHRFHTRDPRAARLFQMALELEVEGGHIQMIRAVEMVAATSARTASALPVNIDGAIAAVCGDLGIPPSVANALFIISRVPGIAAQAQEERNRQHADAPDRSEGSHLRRAVGAPAAGAAEVVRLLAGSRVRGSGFDSGLVHHPPLMNAGGGCRALASQSDAEAGLSCR